MGSLNSCIQNDRHEHIVYKGYDDKESNQSMETKEGTTTTTSDLGENREKFLKKQKIMARMTSENLENPNANGRDEEHEKVLEVSQRDIVALKLRTMQGQLGGQKRALQINLDKVQAEAKECVEKHDKEGAIFALRRKKLYEQYLTDAEEQWLQLDKAISDTESGVMTSRYVQMLKNTNDMVKMIESAEHFENLHKNQDDAAEKEQKTKEFGKLFEQRRVGQVDDWYEQLEREVGHGHDHHLG